ncbi:MAG: hypothetical protein D6755_03925 [Anaerolineae bacterium]|nr:MAG: hypothetical protein D6755_03925 [Anaerolineae bacterium]
MPAGEFILSSGRRSSVEGTRHWDAQADTLIPGAGSPLAWNRYAYVNDNPLRYRDPSGHLSCNAAHVVEGDCSDMTTQQILETYYDVVLSGDWTVADISAIYRGVSAIGAAFANEGDTGAKAFTDVFDTLTFTLDGGARDGKWYCTGSGSGFSCDPDAVGKITARLVTHELGHTFNATIANNGHTTPYNDLFKASIRDDNGNWVTGRKNGEWERGYRGYKSQGVPDLYHGPNNWNDDATGTVNEEFADMFMNWVFNSFDYRPNANGAGTARYNWMSTNMAEWINRARK